MSYTSMVSRPQFDYDKVVETVVGAVNTEEEGPEGDAKRALLNHLLLQRSGMNMEGRLGLHSTRGKLAELYVKNAQGKTEKDKSKEAVQKVDALIFAFNKALDKIKFPRNAKITAR